MFNQQYKNFETQLLDLVNNSNLPIAGAYYILKAVLLQVENLYIQAIQDEIHNAQSQVTVETMPLQEVQDIESNS